MQHERIRPIARIGVVPIQAMLAPLPAVCFIGAFATDLAYWRTAAVMWETFSIWLLTAGLVLGGLAALAGLVDLLGDRRDRTSGMAWLRALGGVLVLILSLLNAFVHSRDGYTAVVPTGLALSGVVVILVMLTAWAGWSLAHHRRLGVSG